MTGNFRAYFQDFDIIRDDVVPGGGAIQAAPMDSAEDVDHYAALGLEPGAGTTEVKDAYRTLAKLYHPDRKNGLADKSKFIAVQSAYEAITGTQVPTNDGLHSDAIAPPPYKDAASDPVRGRS